MFNEEGAVTVYRCDNTIESIFTAIYMAYEEKCVNEAYIALHDEPILFAHEVQVHPCEEKVVKVLNTLLRRFGERDYYAICCALASEDSEKAQHVFGTIRHGLEVNSAPGHLLDHLANDDVLCTFKLAKNVNREIEHLQGFLRFQELENGMLYAKIGPKSNIVTFLMPHFADRLSIENFVIYDDVRGIFGIHPAGKEWFIRIEKDFAEPEVRFSEAELFYSELFRHFCDSIAIKARENRELQRNMLPIRFRKYMMEFDTL